MFCTMLIYLLIANYDSLTCTSLSDPSFHCRNVCDKCCVHQFFFYFVRSNSIYDWSTFLQKIRVTCPKLVLFRSWNTHIYLQLKQIPRNSAWKQRKRWKTCSWLGHELLHTTIIIFFDSVLNDLTWPRYMYLLSSRIFYYLLSILLILYKT